MIHLPSYPALHFICLNSKVADHGVIAVQADMGMYRTVCVIVVTSGLQTAVVLRIALEGTAAFVAASASFIDCSLSPPRLDPNPREAGFVVR